MRAAADGYRKRKRGELINDKIDLLRVHSEIASQIASDHQQFGLLGCKPSVPIFASVQICGEEDFHGKDSQSKATYSVALPHIWVFIHHARRREVSR